MFGKRTFAVTPQVGIRELGIKGLGESGNTHERLTSVAIPDGMVLVTREDIYSRCQPEVLLLKAGQRVDDVLLEKLIRHGAQPGQLVLKRYGASETGRTATSPMTSPVSRKPAMELKMELDPVEPVEHSVATEEKSLTQKVLVFDADDRGVKRLTHCLLSCGIRITDIHCVRLNEHIVWAANKYQPETVFLSLRDTHLSGAAAQKMQETVCALKAIACVKRVVIVGDAASAEIMESQQLYTESAESLGCSLVFKPVSRFNLNPCLQSGSNGASIK